MSAADDAVYGARLVLGWIVEPGSEELYRLTTREGPVGALEMIRKGAVSDELRGNAAARLRAREPAVIAELLRQRATRLGVRVIAPESPDWPHQLQDLARISVPHRGRIERDTYPPQTLWLSGNGNLADLAGNAVSIVGARASTAYGDHVAAELAYGLADRGWTIVSGGAHGIDAAAHKAALATGGATIAVLACGVDYAYPAGHAGLFEEIRHDGLLISEWPPGMHPHRHRFLVRNRVIAVLSKGTVLVEASLRSGARQTLRRARQLLRISMAVPGPATSDMSHGCHDELRRDGPDQVRLVCSPAHVLSEVGPIGTELDVASGPRRAYDDLDSVDLRLVEAVPKRGSAAAARIAGDAGVALLDTLARLPSLVLRGILREVDGGARFGLAGNATDRKAT